MHFPKLHEIATKDVVTVSCTSTIRDSIEVLKQSTHRSVIVENDTDYHLFSANDLLSIKLKHSDLDIRLEDVPLSVVPQMNNESSVLEAMDLVSSGIEYICVVNDDRSLYGLVANSDIISGIDPETLMDNFRLKDFYKKTAEIHYMDREKTVEEAIVLMDRSKTDCIIVTKDNIPDGILTIKDTLGVFSGNSDLSSKIEEIYTSPIQTVPDKFTIKYAVEFIKNKNFKRVVASNEEGEITCIITQQELISYSYSHWASMMKNYHDELIKLNKELEEKSKKLQTMATTDMLTKIYNRHMFTELFNKFLEKKRRGQEDNLVIALLDIDNFKFINDTYGHLIGDEVLVSVSNILTKTLRSSDIIARWGGEEFIVLLTNADLDKCFDKIETLREVISQSDEPKKLTVSIGLAEVKSSDSLESVFKRADEALYKIKKNGKNATAIAK